MLKSYSLNKDGNVSLSEHFKVREFRCKDGSDKILINTDLIDALERLYNQLGVKAVNITSGYRTDSHSVKVGGYAGDQHTKGNAADVTAKRQDGSLFSSKEITLALEAIGHNGGVGLINRTNSVHVDVRGKKCWFDETNHEKIVNSWSEYWGVSSAPAATPTASAHKGTAYTMTCQMLKVRKSPSTLSRQVGQYKRGEIFYVIAQKGNWCQLESGNWMCAGKYLKKV